MHCWVNGLLIFLPRGDYNEKEKYIDEEKNSLISRTIRLLLSKRSSIFLCVKGTKVFFMNNRPYFFQKGDTCRGFVSSC